jgi:hypothetical protein
VVPEIVCLHVKIAQHVYGNGGWTVPVLPGMWEGVYNCFRRSVRNVQYPPLSVWLTRMVDQAWGYHEHAGGEPE